MLLVVLAACTPPDLPADLAGVDPASYAPDRVLVGLDTAPRWSLRTRWGTLVPERRIGTGDVAVFPVPDGVDAVEVVADVRGREGVAFAEPDWFRVALGSPDDPLYPTQWNLDAIHVEGAWAHATGAGVVVAVVDSGFRAGGVDAPMRAAGWDFVDDDDDPTDENGHGTHVAGTVAQATDNGVGVAGVAPGAVVMPVRVLDATGVGTVSGVVDGVGWAIEHGAAVINLSIGASQTSVTEELEIDRAVGQGIVVVAASGNDNSLNRVDVPARYPSTIAVGGVDRTLGRAWYSNGGFDLDLVAPGGDVQVDLDADGTPDGVVQETFDRDRVFAFVPRAGTSMASPHVAGAAALLVELGATGPEARAALQGHTTDLGGHGWDRRFGHGLIDVGAAVDAWLAGDVDPPDPPVEITSVDAEYDRLMLRVWFDTSEPATAEVCDDLEVCVRSEGETAHFVRLRTEATAYWVRAWDTAGSVAVVGPTPMP